MTNQIKRNSAVGECDLYGGHLLQVFLFIRNITPYALHDKHLCVNTFFRSTTWLRTFVCWPTLRQWCSKYLQLIVHNTNDN